MFQVKLSLMPSLMPQSIINHSQRLLESVPASRVKHSMEVSYIVADTSGEHMGSDLQKSPRSSYCQIPPAPGRRVSSLECFSTGGVKPPLTVSCSHSHWGPVTSLGTLRQHSIVTQPKNVHATSSQFGERSPS